jgi:hypothetical protein
VHFTALFAPCHVVCVCVLISLTTSLNGLQIPEKQVAEVVTSRQIVVRGTSTTIPLKISDARENRHAMVCCCLSLSLSLSL